jgi:hypothetical protein
MKRKIEVDAGAVRITAVIDSAHRYLTRDEVERVRDQLADRLQEAASGLVYFETPRNRVAVR